MTRAPRRPRRQDRRGRGLRGPLLPTDVPGWRTRSQRFDEIVLDCIEGLPVRFRKHVARIEFGVEDVPPNDPAPWERGEVPLSRVFPADRGLPTRIVLYRRPIEARSEQPGDLVDLVHSVVVEQVAHALGVPPSDLDPRLDG